MGGWTSFVSPTGTSIRNLTRFLTPHIFASPCCCSGQPTQRLRSRRSRRPLSWPTSRLNPGGAWHSGDINNDGCVDIVALNVGAPPSLLLNHCQNGNHRVLFQLLGEARYNRLAIGARVSVRTGKLMQMSEVKGGSSYISQSDLRQHFGLEAYSTINELTIRWPDGAVDTLHDVPADYIYKLVEGRGIQDKVALPSPNL